MNVLHYSIILHYNALYNICTRTILQLFHYCMYYTKVIYTHHCLITLSFSKLHHITTLITDKKIIQNRYNLVLLFDVCGGPEKGRLFRYRVGSGTDTPLTWSWCTWSRPWFPQRRRAWPTLRGGGASQRSGFPWR